MDERPKRDFRDELDDLVAQECEAVSRRAAEPPHERGPDRRSPPGPRRQGAPPPPTPSAAPSPAAPPEDARDAGPADRPGATAVDADDLRFVARCVERLRDNPRAFQLLDLVRSGLRGPDGPEPPAQPVPGEGEETP